MHVLGLTSAAGALFPQFPMQFPMWSNVTAREGSQLTAELLFDDYKVKLDYVTKQYDRMWRRFDFFLTVELALFGYLGYLTFDVRIPEATTFPALLGSFVSVLWFVIGAQDRWLVTVYRDRANKAATRFSEHADGLPLYAEDHAAAETSATSLRKEVRSWYWPWLSMTRVPATIAIAVAILWFGVLAFWGPFADEIARSHAKRANAALPMSGTTALLPANATASRSKWKLPAALPRDGTKILGSGRARACFTATPIGLSRAT
jgi:hypothetical protein